MMTQSLFSLLAVLAVAQCYSPLKFLSTRNSETFQLFQGWQTTHGKSYMTSYEEMTRYRNFVDNIQKVKEMNSRRKTADDATFDLTQFADLSAEEFKNTVLMTSYRRFSDINKQRQRQNTSLDPAPAAFDWTDQSGVVTSVKNQGADGTCWAFAGLANVESLWGKKTGSQSPDLSPQALNDCDGYVDPYAGAVACGPLGATMPGFYLWVIDEGGFMTWDDYPYCMGDDGCRPCAPQGYSAEWCGGEWPYQPCREHDSCDAKYDRSKFVDGLKVTDFVYFDPDEESLRDSLVDTGPLVAGIDATDLQLYSGGVLKPSMCSPDALNHAVLLVGYGQANVGQGQANVGQGQADSHDYWHAKNSWGTHWGEDGFFRIQRGVGACGINSDTSSVVLG